MNIFSELVYEDLINLDNRSADTEAFFKEATERLTSGDFVENTFQDAITVREKKFPTGLELEHTAIAIPHTDVEHITKPFIYINKINSSTLEFVQMGTDDVYVKPEFVIMLGIKDPKEQLGMLSKLMEVFSDEDFLEKMKAVTNEEEVLKIFNEL